jgi:hypothetical protein
LAVTSQPWSNFGLTSIETALQVVLTNVAPNTGPGWMAWSGWEGGHRQTELPRQWTVRKGVVTRAWARLIKDQTLDGYSWAQSNSIAKALPARRPSDGGQEHQDLQVTWKRQGSQRGKPSPAMAGPEKIGREGSREQQSMHHHPWKSTSEPCPWHCFCQGTLCLLTKQKPRTVKEPHTGLRLPFLLPSLVSLGGQL